MAHQLLHGLDRRATHIELNPDLQPRIRALNICALDTERTVELFEGPEHHTGGSSVRKRPFAKSPVRVPAMRLADALTPDEVARMRLIKIDVEGAEFETVAGLIPFLHLTRPDFEVVVETAPDWEYAGRVARVEDMIQLFAQHGFYAYGLKKQPYVSRTWHAKPVRIESDPNWGHLTSCSRAGIKNPSDKFGCGANRDETLVCYVTNSVE